MIKVMKALLPALGILAFVAFLTGTAIWVFYPHIHALFPNAAQQGIIAEELGWWDAVCISWLFGALFKTTISHKG